MSRRTPGRDRPPPAPPLRVVAAVPISADAGDHDADAVEDEPAVALWAAYRTTGSRVARDRLVLHYGPLVRTVVRRTAGRLPAHVDHADLVQSGVFGLLGAVERYDPERCPRFESYAVPRIRGAVLDELRAQDWVPRTVRLRVRDAERARELLTARLRRTATEREVAEALQVGERELWTSVTLPALSVELMCEGAEGGTVDVFADDAADPAETAQEREMRRRLWRAVAGLGERDRQVVRLYYLEKHTLAEIGHLLGVTESRICQLHTRLVGRLRRVLEEPAAG